MISSLPPKSFPVINLSNFKVSDSSVSSTSTRTAFPDYSNLKFQNKQNAMPNLFQYNDRQKLILSSDQQQEHEPSFNFEEKKGEPNQVSEFRTDYNETVKKSKKNLYEQDDNHPETQFQSKQIKLIKVQNKKEQKHVVDAILQQKQQENEELITPKVYTIKGQSKNKNFTSYKLQSNISEVIIAPKKVEQTPVIQKQEKIQPHKEEQIVSSFQRTYHNQPISKQQQTIKKIQFNDEEKRQMSTIKQQSNSNTQYMLQRIQSDKNTINLASQSERRQDNVHQPQNLTPRKRKRNKIFDKSSMRRQPSYLNSQKAVTPQRGVQTVDRPEKQFVREEERSKNMVPQIKALNILDKLVDQIGNEKVKSRNYSNMGQKDQSLSSTELIDFNKLFLNEIIILQNINCITQINQPHFEQRLKVLQQKIQKWNQQLQNTSPFLINNQVINKFNRLNELFSTMMIVIAQYKQTLLRLELFQKKLEDYVIILRDKDTKRLYLLRRDLSIELELLNQLKAGCGKSKFQKMFSEYLSTEIKLLEQIKQGIDDNFGNPSTIFKF